MRVINLRTEVWMQRIRLICFITSKLDFDALLHIAPVRNLLSFYAPPPLSQRIFCLLELFGRVRRYSQMCSAIPLTQKLELSRRSARLSLPISLSANARAVVSHRSGNVLKYSASLSGSMWKRSIAPTTYLLHKKQSSPRLTSLPAACA